MYTYQRATLKAAARRDLAPKYWRAVLTTFIYIAIAGGQSIAAVTTWGISIYNYGYSSATLVNPTTLTFILYGPMSYGIARYFTDIIRTSDEDLSTVFCGFKNLGGTLILGLLQQIYTFLWLLLFVVPGIVKAISYSMSFYIQRDNPNMTANECLQASMKLTYGHKSKIFGLYMSFLGWALLSLLTAGIGLFFLAPYVFMSHARMYDYLILNYNEKNYKTEQVPYVTYEERQRLRDLEEKQKAEYNSENGGNDENN